MARSPTGLQGSGDAGKLDNFGGFGRTGNTKMDSFTANDDRQTTGDLDARHILSGEHI